MIIVKGRGIHKPVVSVDWDPENEVYRIRVDDAQNLPLWMELTIPLIDLERAKNEAVQTYQSGPDTGDVG